MTAVSMTVNGKAVSADVEDRTLLVHLIRETFGLTGTHIGCDTSQCGACVVLVDGVAVKSCTMLAGQADGWTVDHHRGACHRREAPSHAAGLPRESRPAVRLLHPGHDHDRGRHGAPAGQAGSTRATVRHELEGNICRCTGYHNIVKAIQAGAANM